LHECDFSVIGDTFQIDIQIVHKSRFVSIPAHQLRVDPALERLQQSECRQRMCQNHHSNRNCIRVFFLNSLFSAPLASSQRSSMSWCVVVPRRLSSTAAATASAAATSAPRTRRVARIASTAVAEAAPVVASVVQAPPKPAVLSKKAKAEEAATSANFLVKAPYLFSIDLGIKKIAYCLYNTFGEAE
jgi:hypothetical protein